MNEATAVLYNLELDQITVTIDGEAIADVTSFSVGQCTANNLCT
jgi:hypothetical protein